MVPSGDVLKASAIVYLMPVIALFAGYFLGEYLGRTELFGIASAAIFTTLSFLMIILFDKYVVQRQKPKARIVSIIS